MINIITVNYNNYDGLLSTVQTVIGQSFNEWRMYIIDGGSSDESSNYQPSDERIVFVSEPDDGIYDGMNKGILGLPKKGFSLFLNSGDLLFDEKVLEKMSVFFVDEQSVYYGSIVADYGGYYVINRPRKIKEYWKEKPFHHQAAFYPNVELNQNLFDTRYSYCSDYDQFHSLFEKGLSFQEVDIIVSRVERVYGSSTILKNFYKVWLENFEIAQKFQLSFFQIFWHIFSFVRRFLVKIMPLKIVKYMRIKKNK